MAVKTKKQVQVQDSVSLVVEAIEEKLAPSGEDRLKALMEEYAELYAAAKRAEEVKKEINALALSLGITEKVQHGGTTLTYVNPTSATYYGKKLDELWQYLYDRGYRSVLEKHFTIKEPAPYFRVGAAKQL